MDITAETTDEQMLAPIETARAALIEQAQNGTRGTVLVDLANRVAYFEGVARARSIYRGGLRAMATDGITLAQAQTKIRQRLLEMLVQGADDDHSGRGNDGKRSAFDGFCKEAAILIERF